MQFWRKPNTYEQKTIDLLREFDPNQQTEHDWASYIPYRTPAFKVHRKRAAALSAISGHNNGILYEFDRSAGRWNEVFRIEAAHLRARCEDCGKGVTPDMRGAISYGERLRMVWLKKSGRIVDPPQARFVCSNCRVGY